MGRRKGPKTHLNNVQISDVAYDFLMRRKAARTEALYRVLDRVIDYYTHTDKAELEIQTTKQAKVIEIYYNRIKELEAGKQTTFATCSLKSELR